MDREFCGEALGRGKGLCTGILQFFSKKKGEEKELDTSETAANSIRGFRIYVQRKQNPFFFGGTLILQSKIILS